MGAHLPVTLSLFRLRTHSLRLWFILTRRGGGLALWSSNAASSGSNTYSNSRSSDTYGSSDPDQITGRRELDEGPATTGSSAPGADEDPLVGDDEPCYLGKAREGFNRSMHDVAAPGDDEDPV